MGGPNQIRQIYDSRYVELLYPAYRWLQHLADISILNIQNSPDDQQKCHKRNNRLRGANDIGDGIVLPWRALFCVDVSSPNFDHGLTFDIYEKRRSEFFARIDEALW